MAIISQTEQLELLLAVYDSGSFSAAARLLDCQVAKVSRAVQHLEQQLGASLFTRTTRRVEPTAEGKAFVHKVRGALTQLQQAEEELKLQQGQPSGVLRVDAASPFVLHQLVPLMHEFRTLYPAIELELMSSDKLIDLIERRTDLAIRIGGLTDSNLHARLLGRSTLHLVASPAYLNLHGVPQQPAELAQHQWLGFADNPRLNLLPLAEPVAIRPAISASSGETLLQLCLAGHGIALLSNFMVRQAINSGQLAELLPGQLQSPHPREQVQAVYYRHSALSGRIKVFLQFLEGRLAL